MSDRDWTREVELLQERGVELAPGLSEGELQRAEDLYGFSFPPDLRSFLSKALPTLGDSFPDWRRPESQAVVDWFAWPFKGIAFDIEHSAFWWESWGRRPEDLQDAISVARAAFARTPRMIPVYSHRYLPAEPGLAGNPVFSIYQTDVIYYGLDLRRYLACEFGAIDHAEATRGELRYVRFWSELVEVNG